MPYQNREKKLIVAFGVNEECYIPNLLYNNYRAGLNR